MASEVINRYFRDGVEMREKGPGDLVSAADVDAEKAIASVIHQAFPNDAILGEESHSAPADADRLWIVDPIDGTTNFAHQIPHFAVSIAYYEHGAPLCGLVHNPITGDWYSAIKGEGAIVNGRKARVNPHAALSQTIVAMGFYPGMTDETKATFVAAQEFVRAGVHGIRRCGAASLDFCNVGCGFYGAYFEYQLSPWDFAAGRSSWKRPAARSPQPRANHCRRNAPASSPPTEFSTKRPWKSSAPTRHNCVAPHPSSNSPRDRYCGGRISPRIWRITCWARFRWPSRIMPAGCTRWASTGTASRFTSSGMA